jgi:hypothetical protein
MLLGLSKPQNIKNQITINQKGGGLSCFFPRHLGNLAVPLFSNSRITRNCRTSTINGLKVGSLVLFTLRWLHKFRKSFDCVGGFSIASERFRMSIFFMFS